MDSEDKFQKFILELTRKTFRGDVLWTKSLPGEAIRHLDETTQDLVYTSTVNNKRLRIYKYKTKHYRDEYDWDYVDRIKLESLDTNNNAEFEFPYDYSLHHLYNTIREKTSNIGEFMDDFLKS